jgi:hypothetical protein
MDINIQLINEDVPSREDKQCDIVHFFQSLVEKAVNGKAKDL